MRRLKKYLFTREHIQQMAWVQPIAHRLHHPNLWHLHRRSVAGGVAVGLLCGLIPGPFQMLGSLLLALVWRVNLPVALLMTLYTNPFTILPLYLLAYQLGASVLGERMATSSLPNIPTLSWDNWFFPLLEWMGSLGKSFALGLPLLAVSLAVAGYVLVRVGWRWWVIWTWTQRRHRRYGVKGKQDE